MNIWESRRKARGAVILLLFFSFFAVPHTAYSGGGRDNALERADALIGEGLYDDAIRELSAYIKTNPDDFALAQKRLQQIIKSRDEYNILADELLDVLSRNPDDDERILALTERMSRIEAHPNASIQDFINRARSVALFTYNRKELEKILAEGRGHLAAGNYGRAMTTYARGFSFYRDELTTSEYGEMVVARVESSLDEINNTLGRFDSLLASLNSVLDTMEQRTAGAEGSAGFVLFEESYAALAPVLTELMGERNLLAGAAGYFSNQLALLKEADQSLGDASFFPFASLVLLGPSGEKEGMLGAFERIWENSLRRFDTALNGALERTYAAARSLSGEKRYDEAAGGFDSLLAYWDLYKNSTRLEGLRTTMDIPQSVDIDGESVVLGKVPDYLTLYSLEKMVPYFRNFQELEKRYDGINQEEKAGQEAGLEALAQGAASGGAAFEDLLRIYQTYAGFGPEIAAVLDELDAEEAAILAYEEEAGSRAFVPVYIEDARKQYTELAGLAQASAGSSVLRTYTIVSGDLKERLAGRESEYAESQSLLEGRAVEVPGSEPYTAKYPAEANEILDSMIASLERDIPAAASLLGIMDAENARPGSEEEKVIRESEADSARLSELLTLGQELRAATALQMAQAESYRLDGDRLLQESQAAVAQGNFDMARERLIRAGDRYDASLGLQDSAELRATRDQSLLAIGADIIRQQNAVVVREVRQLVTNARTVYFTGNFEQAEDMLLRAQSRWRTVSPVDTDAEVDYWLTMVRNALSQRSGKVIPVTAPLYSEMSQLLSDANLAFDEGARLLNTGRRPAGLARLSEARKKTQEVRLVFPLNQDAGILQLRIDQITDPRAFDASFGQRFTTAMETIRQSRSQEAFADLQNLAAINPRFRGMSAAVSEAEILMGIRPPPPDPRDLAQSRTLTQSARGIINANVQAQLPVAMEQLNQAISLDPTNTEAIDLKDTLQIRIGGETVVLSNAAEREYKRAVDALQQGNTIVALSIVQQLLQDPQNRNSARIIELQRRIESVL